MGLRPHLNVFHEVDTGALVDDELNLNLTLGRDESSKRKQRF